MDNNGNKFDAPQMIEKQSKLYGLDKQDDKKVSYFELRKDGNNSLKRTTDKLEATPFELSREVREGSVKVIVPSSSYIREQNNKSYIENFKAPQMISKDDKTFGFANQDKDKLTYAALKRDENNKWKRTGESLETNVGDLAKDIKNRDIKVVMPHKDYQKEIGNAVTVKPIDQEIVNKVNAAMQNDPKQAGELNKEMIAKNLDKFQSVPDRINDKPLTMIDKYELLMNKEHNLDEKTKIQMNEKNQLLIKEGNNKAELVSKDNVAYKQEKKVVQETKEIPPIEVNPLTKREREEVKEAFEKGKFQDNIYAQNMFKKFDKQLESIPDKARGERLDNQDKMKLLVGDALDKPNTSLKIVQNKIQYEPGLKSDPKESVKSGVLDSSNSQFSERQIEKQAEKSATKPQKVGMTM